MLKRTLSAAALLAAASSSWGYQINVTEAPGARVEGDELQTIGVELLLEQNDGPDQCELDITVSAQGLAEPGQFAATPNADFVPTTETVRLVVDSDFFQDSDTVDVAVIDDDIAEPLQFFDVEVTDVQVVSGCNADPVFNINTPFGMPIEDDDAGNVGLAASQPSIVVNEGAGSVDIVISVTGADTVEGDFFIDAQWALIEGSATNPEDFSGPTSGSLFFDRATQTATVTVPIVEDSDIEPTEDFDFVISEVFGGLADESPLSVSLASANANVQILDNDSPGTVSFAGTPFQVNEPDGDATITLRRSGGSAGAITVFYRTADATATAGEDYQASSGSVQWTDGDTEDKTFTIPILDDATAEGDETLLIQISPDSEFVEFQEATLTIVDDESFATTGFTATTASVEATEDEVVLTLIRGGSTAGTVTVDYATADGAAVAGEDYVAAAGTITWADGDGADKIITVQLIPDPEREEAEEFTVALSNVTGPANLGTNSTITVTLEPPATRDIAEIPTLTPNQRSLAQYFDRTCAALEGLADPSEGQLDLVQICGVLRDIGTDDAAVREALDAINPEELQVSTFNALRLTGLQHGNLGQRLNALRNGASGVNLTGLNLEIGGQQIAGNALQEMFDGITGGAASADEAGSGRWGAFINGRIATGDQDGSDDEAGFDFDLYAVTLGVDYRLKPNLIVGVSAGFGAVETDYERGGGGMDIDSWNGAIYLTYFRDQSFYLDALATYGRNDYDSERQISFGVVDRVARGKTDGTQASIGFGTGWDFNRGPWTFGPHLGAYYFDVDVDGFAETGAGGLDVIVGDQNSQSLTVNGGGHVSYALLTDWGVLVPNARLDWVHEFEDGRETLSFNFVNDPFTGNPNDPSPTITLQGSRPEANYFIWSLGVSAQFIHGFSGFVNHQSYAGYGGLSFSEWNVGARWEKTF